MTSEVKTPPAYYLSRVDELIAGVMGKRGEVAEYTDLDYQLDTVLRQMLDVPERPDWRLPYEGLIKPPDTPISADGPPFTQELTRLLYDVPYRSQRDNDADKYSYAGNECSGTSMAMAALAFGFKGQGLRSQLEDEISFLIKDKYKAPANGAVEWMARYMREEYGCKVKVDMSSTVPEMIDALNRGCVIVCHTGLTNSGHVVCIVGYDRSAYDNNGAFIVNDPWGEWMGSPGAYDKAPNQGKEELYSFRFASSGGFYWHHEISHPSRQLQVKEMAPK